MNENVAVDVEENTAFLPGSNPIDATLEWLGMTENNIILQERRRKTKKKLTTYIDRERIEEN